MFFFSLNIVQNFINFHRHRLYLLPRAILCRYRLAHLASGFLKQLPPPDLIHLARKLCLPLQPSHNPHPRHHRQFLLAHHQAAEEEVR